MLMRSYVHHGGGTHVAPPIILIPSLLFLAFLAVAILSSLLKLANFNSSLKTYAKLRKLEWIPSQYNPILTLGLDSRYERKFYWRGGFKSWVDGHPYEFYLRTMTARNIVAPTRTTSMTLPALAIGVRRPILAYCRYEVLGSGLRYYTPFFPIFQANPTLDANGKFVPGAHGDPGVVAWLQQSPEWQAITANRCVLAEFVPDPQGGQIILHIRSFTPTRRSPKARDLEAMILLAGRLARAWDERGLEPIELPDEVELPSVLSQNSVDNSSTTTGKTSPEAPPSTPSKYFGQPIPDTVNPNDLKLQELLFCCFGVLCSVLISLLGLYLFVPTSWVGVLTGTPILLIGLSLGFFCGRQALRMAKERARK